MCARFEQHASVALAIEDDAVAALRIDEFVAIAGGVNDSVFARYGEAGEDEVVRGSAADGERSVREADAARARDDEHGIAGTAEAAGGTRLGGRWQHGGIGEEGGDAGEAGGHIAGGFEEELAGADTAKPFARFEGVERSMQFAFEQAEKPAGTKRGPPGSG